MITYRACAAYQYVRELHDAYALFVLYSSTILLFIVYCDVICEFCKNRKNSLKSQNGYLVSKNTRK